MTIQQLEYILAVDQFRHFARAAEYCRVTQPTLSAMIQKLEEELGVKLFDSRNTSSPSFREIEFTIDLPCRHFNPASITSHLEESIITGTRAISGSDMMRFRKVVISVRASSRPSSILTSITKAPSSTC